MTTLIVLVALPAASYAGYRIMGQIDRFIDRRVKKG